MRRRSACDGGGSVGGVGATAAMGRWLPASAVALLALWGGALVGAYTDYSAETEFASSASSKYPDTESVVPYQPSNINMLEIGTNWFFLSWLAPYDGGSTVTHYEVRLRWWLGEAACSEWGAVLRVR